MIFEKLPFLLSQNILLIWLKPMVSFRSLDSLILQFYGWKNAQTWKLCSKVHLKKKNCLNVWEFDIKCFSVYALVYNINLVDYLFQCLAEFKENTGNEWEELKCFKRLTLACLQAENMYCVRTDCQTKDCKFMFLLDWRQKFCVLKPTDILQVLQRSDIIANYYFVVLSYLAYRGGQSCFA